MGHTYGVTGGPYEPPMHSVCSASSLCFSWEAVVRWHTPQPGKVSMELLSVEFFKCHLVM